LRKGKIGIKTLIKFVNLCNLTMNEARVPTLEEVMENNNCSKGHAYHYIRALKYLYPDELLDRVRQIRQDRERYVQQTLE
jgi:hypothetical protein